MSREDVRANAPMGLLVRSHGPRPSTSGGSRRVGDGEPCPFLPRHQSAVKVWCTLGRSPSGPTTPESVSPTGTNRMTKTPTTSEPTLKRRLVEASRILAMEGQGDLVWGHVSGRVPGADTFWIKATGVGLDEVRVEDLLLCDLEGRVVRGKK